MPPWLGSARGWTGSQGSHHSLASPVNLLCSKSLLLKRLRQLTGTAALHFQACIFYLGRRSTNVEQTPSQCMQWSHPRSLSCSPQGVTAVLPSLWLHGRTFPIGKSTLVPQSDKGSGSTSSRGTHPTSGCSASKIQSVLQSGFLGSCVCLRSWTNGFDRRLSPDFWVQCQVSFIQIKLPLALVLFIILG